MLPALTKNFMRCRHTSQPKIWWSIANHWSHVYKPSNVTQKCRTRNVGIWQTAPLTPQGHNKIIILASYGATTIVGWCSLTFKLKHSFKLSSSGRTQVKHNLCLYVNVINSISWQTTPLQITFKTEKYNRGWLSKFYQWDLRWDPHKYIQTNQVQLGGVCGRIQWRRKDQSCGSHPGAARKLS